MRKPLVLISVAVVLVAAGLACLLFVLPGPWDLISAALTFAGGACGFAAALLSFRRYRELQ